MARRKGACADWRAGADTFGLYDLGDKVNLKENKRPRVVSGGGVALERVRMQVGSVVNGSGGGADAYSVILQLDEQRQRLVSTHEKDLGRLQAKLQRAEAAAVAAKAELGQLKSDLRSSSPPRGGTPRKLIRNGWQAPPKQRSRRSPRRPPRRTRA